MIDPGRRRGSAIGRELGFAWKLVRAYWTSPDQRWAYGLAGLIAAREVSMVCVAVWQNAWHKQFYDTLTNRDLPGFYAQCLTFLAIALTVAVLIAGGSYLKQALHIRWRACVTDIYLERWLGNDRFYAIERAKAVDNPDQRIAADLDLAVSLTMTLVVGLVSTMGTLGSFLVLLWQQSGALAFVIAGINVTVPGYMVWVAIVFAVTGSVLSQYAGRMLTSVNVAMQRVEADFRVGLVRVRDNAEQIAFYRGAPAEHTRLRQAFAAIRDNWRQVMGHTLRVAVLQDFYNPLADIAAKVLLAPRYFSGAVTLGGIQQVSGSFAAVVVSLSWFVHRFQDVAVWRAAMQRLLLLDAAIESPDPAGIVRDTGSDDRLQATGLRLDLPDGTALLAVGNFSVARGERVLVRGRSGSGKSTLLRALAGLWPHGAGAVAIPAQAQLMFLPQRSYVPAGTLQAALCYPSEEGQFDAAACHAALSAVGLATRSDRLSESDDWSSRLSPGEQQRLAAARALLRRPDYLFLDEATSALDPDLERQLYEALIEALPHAAIVSIAHRPALAKYHQRVVVIGEVADSAAATLVPLA